VLVFYVEVELDQREHRDRARSVYIWLGESREGSVIQRIKRMQLKMQEGRFQRVVVYWYRRGSGG
jgi:hypothetical protein